MRNPTDVVEPPVEEDLPDPSLQVVVAWQAYAESLLLLVKKDGINCVVIFFCHGLLSITCKQLALLLQNTIVSEWFPSVLKEAEPNRIHVGRHWNLRCGGSGIKKGVLGTDL